MAGGSGTRLWPMSRKASPKQLHKLTGEESLLQETYNRIKDLVLKDNIYVSVVESVYEQTKKQLKDIPSKNYIIEPEVRNNGPAVALIAATLLKINHQAIVATVATDHTIQKVSNFQKAILSTFHFIENNPSYFTTIGIKPTRPDTGFGYIKQGIKLSKTDFYQVDRFVEKPNYEKATEYLKSGKYLWNGSYFTWQAASMISLYQKLQPDIYRTINTIINSKNKNIIADRYHSLPKEPFDTLIAEKADKIAVIPVDLDWSDVGTWSSLYEILRKKHSSNNVSKGNHIGLDDKNCLIYAQDKLLATIGLENIVIVDTKDVTLVCDITRSQDVKKLLEKIKKEGKPHYL